MYWIHEEVQCQLSPANGTGPSTGAVISAHAFMRPVVARPISIFAIDHARPLTSGDL